MSVKYLYTLKRLGVDGIDDYFINHNKEFHAPLDSYVLDHLKEGGCWSGISTYERYKNIVKKISFEEEYNNWPNYAKRAKIKKNGYEKLADKGSYKRYIQDEFSNKAKTYCGKIRWRSKSESDNDK